MNRHLNDEDLAAAVAGIEVGADVTDHLASCLHCRASVTEMRDLLASRRAQLVSPEPDWQVQQEQILERVAEVGARPPGAPRRWRAAVLAAAAAVLLAVGIASLTPSPERSLGAGAHDLQVEQVLAEVDALLADEAIPGLWPADPLSDTEELEALFSNPAS